MIDKKRETKVDLKKYKNHNYLGIKNPYQHLAAPNYFSAG